MQVDVALHPFGADVASLVRTGVAAERRGAGAAWVPDHFSARMIDRAWSRDPFVLLGALAASTSRIGLGTLVANMVNRHPAQLACAVNSVQSLAPGRVLLGVGSGAGPGSRFALEHEAIGRTLEPTARRRADLVAHLAALRAIWATPVGGATPRRHDASEGSGDAAGPEGAADDVGASAAGGVVDGAPIPPLIVGASSWGTIDVALAHADGVNLRDTDRLGRQLERLDAQRRPGFEVSVLVEIDDVVADPARIDRLAGAGVDRLIVGVSPRHDPTVLDLVDWTR
ncbi:LLM class flavin-dependent oxidoreductase [Ilumatobacter sp.]|uniref:LLM class flavin-dependent oxidoreductase n=1 Tax=Ilumatobacter sp. TaxID=1967498 RepID=UPI003B51DA71